MLELALELARVPDVAGVDPGDEVALDHVEQPVAGVGPAAVRRVARERRRQVEPGGERLDGAELRLRRAVVDDDQAQVAGPALRRHRGERQRQPLGVAEMRHQHVEPAHGRLFGRGGAGHARRPTARRPAGGARETALADGTHRLPDLAPLPGTLRGNLVPSGRSGVQIARPGKIRGRGPGPIRLAWGRPGAAPAQGKKAAAMLALLRQVILGGAGPDPAAGTRLAEADRAERRARRRRRRARAELAGYGEVVVLDGRAPHRLAGGRTHSLADTVFDVAADHANRRASRWATVPRSTCSGCGSARG